MPVRYVRVAGAPRRIAEIEGEDDDDGGGRTVDRTRWRASNLLAPYRRPPALAWSGTFTLDEIAPNAYLAIALPGRHGDEGAVAAVRVGDRYLGAPDRAVSYPSNTWEYKNVERDRDYTYFVPLTADLAGRPLEVVVLGFSGCDPDLLPEVYVMAHPPPLATRELVLEEAN